jgi:putative ABC transport system permease protein
MLTGIIVVMMFYIILFLANQNSLNYKYGEGGVYGGQYLQTFLVLGSIIIAIFSVIFLFYTNSFLIKRRQKEFGIYIVLGMEKRHLAVVQFYETLYAGLVSIVLLPAAFLFSKLSCCFAQDTALETPLGFP